MFAACRCGRRRAGLEAEDASEERAERGGVADDEADSILGIAP